jgi:hypothetical protein
MWRCLSPQERAPLAAGEVYGEDPVGSSGIGPKGNLRIVEFRAYEPVLVRELHTRELCAPHYSKAYVLSRDGEDGEMHIPVICKGRRGEFIWHMSGEFDRYLGLVWI